MEKVQTLKIKMMNNPQCVYNSWNDVYVGEIWCYFPIQLLMGISYVLVKKSLLMTPIFSKLMRRGRFEYIRKMLHFVDSLGLDHYIVTCKLEAFLEILRTLHSLELYSSQNNK